MSDDDEKLDPEIIDGFRQETCELIVELQNTVEKIEECDPKGEFPSKLLEDFAQVIDRVMGAAKTLQMMDEKNLGLDYIGKLAELCKKIGYDAAKSKRTQLLPIFAAFWSETLEIIEELVETVGDESKVKDTMESNAAIVRRRLEWLVKRVTPEPGDQNLSQLNVDEMLKGLGL